MKMAKYSMKEKHWLKFIQNITNDVENVSIQSIHLPRFTNSMHPKILTGVYEKGIRQNRYSVGSIK